MTRRALVWQLGATFLVVFVALLAAPAQATPVPATPIPTTPIPATSAGSRAASAVADLVRDQVAPGRAPVDPGLALVGPRQHPAALVGPRQHPAAPPAPTPPAGPKNGSNTVGITVDTGTGTSKPSTSITILIALTVLSVAPALLLLCTSFTKIFVVLSITRNALGLTSVPPNQVLSGLALFLSLFVMAPVLSDMNHDGVQPYLHGTKTQAVAFHDGAAPLRTFMLHHTRKDEIALLTRVANQKQPANPDSVPLQTLIPSFVLSELRAAFIIGFVIYIPFLVVDMVVSASLMSMGMMMLPPVTVSLPFKMLLFVLVNGWGLVITALVSSYR